MRRRRKVEGLVIDLTKFVEGTPFILEELIVKGKVYSPCDVCALPMVGAVRPCDGKNMCGLCCAQHENKIRADVYERLKSEYAKPCGFCGEINIKKHFDHVNMFTKAGCIGFMVEKSVESDLIVAELDKCQILCVPCHEKVTLFEKKKGFFRKKRALNKKVRAGEDVTEMRAALFKEYEEIIGPFYEAQRGNLSGSG